MNQEIRHILLAFAAAILLFGGCVGRRTLDIDGNEIVFGTQTILDGQGTKAHLETGTTFSPEDKIAVWGWHQRGTTGDQLIFENQAVTCPASGTIWTYSPKRKWAWEDSDFYDFLAVAYKRDGLNKRTIQQEGIRCSANEGPSGTTLTISVPYNAESGQYDLLMAGTRRTDLSSDVVNLEFRHMLSAVKVVFYKDDAGDAIDYRIKAYHFTNLITQADIQYGGWIDAEGFAEGSVNALRRSAPMLGWTFDPTPHLPLIDNNYDIDHPYDHDPDSYDLMIPQHLDPDDAAPKLVVTFEDLGANEYERTVDLKLIPEDDVLDEHGDPVPITRWESGHIYTYKIGISLNAGVIIRVTTTPWTVIDAKTPGLII